MMTKDEARSAVEAELRSRKLTTPMKLEELNVFCEQMYKRLQFKSKKRTTGRHSEMGRGLAV